MTRKLTVHMIGNAHLDPVWMWTWPAGVDEAINTCRTFCKMLDEYPEFVVTRGEAWVYEQVRRYAPDIFRQIRKHIDTGRWGVVNGWWVQTDTNFPRAETFRAHGRIGKRWFREHLQKEVRCGYQVDSFGHTANLPAFLQSQGLSYYCFSRPTPELQELPAELFRWRALTGESVIAFRIPDSYCMRGLLDMQKALNFAIETANRDLGHTMCFYGIGDHGGGPSRQQVEWILANRNYRDDVELVFSQPDAFFAQVEQARPDLPVFEGELRRVEPGTYAAMHHFKQQFRRAENLVIAAEKMAKEFPERAPDNVKSLLNTAWEPILFNSFHDILPGTSIEPAYEDARDEIGYAKMLAKRILVDITRRRTVELPGAARQRMILHNIGPRRVKGLVEVEPWLGAEMDTLPVRFFDAEHAEIPNQRIAGQSAELKMSNRYLIPIDVPAYGERVFEIDQEAEPKTIPAEVTASQTQIANSLASITVCDTGVASIELGGKPLLGEGGIRLVSLEDHTDTWGGGLPDGGYFFPETGQFTMTQPWKIIEDGPLRAKLSAEFGLRQSRMIWHVWVGTNDPIIRMRLRLYYQGCEETLKLLVPAGFAPEIRIDGIPGGKMERPLDGQEYPIHNHMALAGSDAALALTTQDVYAADVQESGILRLTLVRGKNFVFNDNFPNQPPDPQVFPLQDQGEHVYDISLLPLKQYDLEAILDEANRQINPLWMSENTHGMPPRHHEGREEKEQA